MAGLVNAEEFARFLVELPREWEARLTDGDGVSTGFFKARQRGWTFVDLVAEARRIIGQGMGQGAIISRFQAMAISTPVRREGGQTVPTGPAAPPLPGEAHPFSPDSQGDCLFCSLPRRNRVHRGESVPSANLPYRRNDEGERIPWEWHKERMELLRRIGRGGFTPDAAENEMRALIARQRASRNTDPFA